MKQKNKKHYPKSTTTPEKPAVMAGTMKRLEKIMNRLNKESRLCIFTDDES